MKVWNLAAAFLSAGLIVVSCSRTGKEAPSGPANVKTSKPASTAPKNAKNPETQGNTGNSTVKTIQVTAPWVQKSDIPLRYVHPSKGGSNVSPALKWNAVSGASEYLIVMVDHHPVAKHWLHWVLTVPGDVTSLPDNASASPTAGMKQYPNTWGHTRYDGPAAPAGTGRHDYHIVVFALRGDVGIPEKPSWTSIRKAVRDMTLATGEVVGYFETK